jgi:DNA-binding transcriptional LysR family regulator
VGEINSLNGALTMVESGAGLSFFPTHCLSKKLVTLPPKAGPGCFNNIYLIHLKAKNKTKRFEAVVNTFLEMV